MLLGAISVTAASPRDLFDADYYAVLYPDVVAAVGDDEVALYNHYVKYGMKEGRSLSPVFDVQSYRERYSDLEAAFGDDWSAYMNHMLEHGLYENRHTVDKDVHALTSEQALTLYAAKVNAKVEKEGVESVLGEFDTEAYKAANPDVANAFGNNVKALVKHYLEHGIKEGRTSTSDKSKDPVEAIKKNPDIITIVAEPIPEKIVEKAEEVKKPSAPAVHQCSFYIVVGEGTCATGIKSRCGCGKIYIDNSRVNIGCQWEEDYVCAYPEEEGGPTCTRAGRGYHECRFCWSEREIELPSLHDSLLESLENLADKSINCVVCGERVGVPICAEHQWDETFYNDVNLSCANGGSAFWLCEVCGEKDVVQLSSIHDYYRVLLEKNGGGSTSCNECGEQIVVE